MIEKNVHLLAPKYLSTWRKVALGSWKTANEAQVFAEIKVDCTKALAHIEQINSSSTNTITLTHFMGKVMGKVVKEVPDINMLIRWNKLYPRRDIDVMFHVVYDESELSSYVVRKIDTKSMAAIATELNTTVKKIKTGDDIVFKKIKKNWKLIPSFVGKMLLDFVSFLSFDLNLHIPLLGIPRDGFGSLWVTNIGSLGFGQAFVPLVNYTRVPFLVALGRPEWKPFCKDHLTVVPRLELSLCFTFDHRLMDGARAAKMGKLIEKYFDNPELLND